MMKTLDLDSIWPGWHVEELIGQGSYGKVYRISREVMGLTSYAAAKLIEVPQDESEISILTSMGMDNLSIRTYLENTARSIVSEIAVMEELKGARNIVSIEDYQLIEHTEDVGWTIWIRMELLEGLVEYQCKHGTPDTMESVRIGIDVCNALALCHKRGVIHRDVKPENVFRDSFGEYKLGDFGIAKQIERSTQSTYSQKGTQHYMAPEVVRGERYDETVDVYSLGLMLYRFLNGMRFPFLPPAPEPVSPEGLQDSLFRRLRGDAFPAPCDADEFLSSIVMRACAFNPAERYHSASEMRTDLIRWANVHGDAEFVTQPRQPLEGMGEKISPLRVDRAIDNAGADTREDETTSHTSGTLPEPLIEMIVDAGVSEEGERLSGYLEDKQATSVDGAGHSSQLEQGLLGVLVVSIVAFIAGALFINPIMPVALVLASVLTLRLLLSMEERMLFGVLTGALAAALVGIIAGIDSVWFCASCVCIAIAAFAAVRFVQKETAD